MAQTETNAASGRMRFSAESYLDRAFGYQRDDVGAGETFDWLRGVVPKVTKSVNTTAAHLVSQAAHVSAGPSAAHIHNHHTRLHVV